MFQLTATTDDEKPDFLYAPILIQEDELTVKTIIEASEKEQGFKLRHAIFAEELGWVPHGENKMEIDRYDRGAVHFGTFDTSGRLLSYLRLMPPGAPYMIEREFINLVSPGHKIRKDLESTEITRLCVAAEARKRSVKGGFGSHSIAMFLYKGVYNWCLINRIRYLYMVIEHKIFRLLSARGFPCKPVGDLVTMPDGVMAVAAIMDWREFETVNARKKPEMFLWFNQRRSTQAEQPLQRPAFDSLHPFSR
jgi:N-acyl amino acid synthase of PEP-CTERM/exosortase system